jgi:Bromodomain
MSGASNAASDETLREEELRKELRSAMQKLKSREPLDAKYTRLLMNGIVTPRRPVLPKDKLYSRLSTNLRASAESYAQQMEGKDPFDRIAQRQPLDESAMRAALTLRDAKEHEQAALLEAMLASLPRRNGMDEATRKRHFDSVASFLTSNKRPAPARSKTPPPASAAEKTEQARQQAELEKQKETTKSREAARKRREEEERRQRADEIDRRNNQVETPQQALQKLYRPIFLRLWNMEFPHLGGINPFRIVIDRDNCASVGAPDYFDIIKTPMNLTYIQQKVDNMAYDSLEAFNADVDLMISNSLLYNSDPANPYHVAAQEMKKRYIKIVKKVLQTIQSKAKA